jgi:uncharacterized protein YndB with AHSA1/START domain
MSSEEVRLEIAIDASPETVFALLTDPMQLKTWLADMVDAEARAGGLFRIEDASGMVVEGIYLEVIPNAKVVFTWGGIEGMSPGQSTVEFVLEADGEGTLVKLRHYGLPRATFEPHRRGWFYSGLPKLKDTAEGRPPARLCLGDLAHLDGAS